MAMVYSEELSLANQIQGMTVGELREIIDGYSDDVAIEVISDSEYHQGGHVSSWSSIAFIEWESK